LDTFSLKNLHITDYKLWVDDTPIRLIGGEVHFWRLAPENWRAALTRVKELGVEVLSTYICWDFHEWAPGRFDFTGDTNPRRNLTNFLNLLTEMDFWIIIRPGPYVYTEWVNAGVPDEAAVYHRLHPEFLRLARRYMEAVVPVLQPHFVTRGGNIILFQPDNEIDSWHQWYTEPLGLGRKPGLFHEFLQERYSTLGEFNKAWSSDLEFFEDARAILTLPPWREDLTPRYLDFCRFKHWFVLKAARWMVDTYHDLGVDVPMYLNTYGTVSVQPWSDLEEIADIAGPDLYPTIEFSHRPDEHRQFLESIRYARSYSRLPYIPEFESGIWHGWHYEVGAPKGNHYRLMCLSALAAGVTGWSWYMLVNRDNWYMSPINEWGRVRPELYTDFGKIVELYHQFDPTSSQRLATTAITFDSLQKAATPQFGQDLLTAFYQADIDYDFYDMKVGCIKPKLLFYCGGSWLPYKSQDQLKKYILEGGHLICIGAYPFLDEYLRPLNSLEIPEPAGVIGDVPESLSLKIEFDSVSVDVCSPWMAHYEEVPGEPIHATRSRGEILTAEEMELITGLVEGDRYIVGFVRSIGEGQLTVIQIAPSPQLLLAIHDMAGVRIPSRSLTAGIMTALYQRGKNLFLFAINTTTEDKVAEIALLSNLLQTDEVQIQDLITECKWTLNWQQGDTVHVTVGHKDATLLKLTPVVEINPTDPNKRSD
jgi:hypothetical protein